MQQAIITLYIKNYHCKDTSVLVIMFQTIFIISALLVSKCCTRDALKYFVEHRIVRNYSFTVLSSMNTSDKVWVEYDYQFNGIKGSKNKKLTATMNVTTVLNVGIFENSNTPFDCKFFDGNAAVANGEFKGYSFEIMKSLQERFHFGVKYIKLNYSNSEYNLTESLLLNKLDLVICHPGVKYEMESEITQLYTTLKSDYVLVYKSNKLHITKDIFILTFAGTLWLCFLVLLIILAVCLHISTQRYSIIYKYELWTWLDITLWANAAACQQGLSHTPSGFASLFIFLLGYLTSYLLYTGFAAGITSLLLQQGVSNDITISNLEKMNLNMVTVVDYITKSEHSFINNSLLVADMDDLFIHIDHENTIGIAPKIFVDQYFADKLNYDMIDLYSTSVFTMARYTRGFVVPKGSVYKKMLNNGLLALQESGLLANALYRSLLPTPAPTITSNYSSAGIEHVGSAILILLVGTLSSTVFLVAELMIALYRSRCYNHSKVDGTGYFKHF